MKNQSDAQDNIIVISGLVWMLTLTVHGFLLNKITNIASIVVSFIFLLILFKVLFFDPLKEQKKEDKINEEKNEIE